jgi:hypothetical protein
MSKPEDLLSAKARTARYLFRYGYIDRENARSQLQRYAEKAGIARELGQDLTQQIIASAFEHIPTEPIAEIAPRRRRA